MWLALNHIVPVHRFIKSYQYFHLWSFSCWYVGVIWPSSLQSCTTNHLLIANRLATILLIVLINYYHLICLCFDFTAGLNNFFVHINADDRDLSARLSVHAIGHTAIQLCFHFIFLASNAETPYLNYHAFACFLALIRFRFEEERWSHLIERVSGIERNRKSEAANGHSPSSEPFNCRHEILQWYYGDFVWKQTAHGVTDYDAMIALWWILRDLNLWSESRIPTTYQWNYIKWYLHSS
jgi:hypothetical protein